MIVERKDTRYVIINENGEIECRNRNGEMELWACFNPEAKEFYDKVSEDVNWSDEEE